MIAAKAVGFVELPKEEVAEECYKISYETPQAAHKVIERNRNRKHRKECIVYLCKYCGTHHITSQRETG